MAVKMIMSIYFQEEMEQLDVPLAHWSHPRNHGKEACWEIRTTGRGISHQYRGRSQKH
ncbi:hypothetical protein XENTR_v10015186 [Xenopus tropicalis]|nr:hypothetical protein XENTR_v10015186 [Xenopus tropicalis]